VTSTDSACECGPSEPASPASRQESQSFKGGLGPDLGESASLPVAASHLDSLSRLIEPARRPPKSPLYLTTSRLNI
jgi:hypothetical protein